MKIAIVVHGRFHAFDLARELIVLGHDVYVLTNYPKRLAQRFGIPRERIRTTVLHGVVSRAMNLIGRLFDRPILEPMLHSWFSLWAAAVVTRSGCDVVHSFSGVSEELFISILNENIVRTLVRGSAHIEKQHELLCGEQNRSGLRAYTATEWMRRREQREYDLADIIVVLSQFAFDSFMERGFSPSKVRIVPLGAQLSVFRPSREVVTARQQRIQSGEPLRILTVGTFSLRKGALDYVTVAKALSDRCRFRFIGTVLPRAKPLEQQSKEHIEFLPRTPQLKLPEQYAWGDVFLFLTVEDGYAVVLAQASAAALPILSTTNCAAPELIKEGENGWVFPIRRPDPFIEKLEWCDTHREELASMVEGAYNLFIPRDWSDVARDFIVMCGEAREKKSRKEADVTRA
jgi:glycosyltransferase involved in cell wall biosynthesis